MSNSADFHIYLYGANRGPLETSFEAAQQRLEQLGKVYFEPDGSFVIALDSGRQQVFGMLYDAAGTLQYCDLRGACNADTFLSICSAITGQAEKPNAQSILQLPGSVWKEFQTFVAESWPETDR